MEENENIENNEIIDNSDSSDSDNVSNDTNEILSEILETLKGADDEEINQENSSEIPLETSENDIIYGSEDNPIYVDMSEIMTYLDSKDLVSKDYMTETVNLILEDKNKNILEKELNEYTVSETLILVVLLVLILKFMCESVERFFVKWR